MRLNADEVRHVAALARIGMTEEELEQMREEMSHILENFDVLSQVDTEDVEPTGHTVDVTSVVREDEPADSYPTSDVLANAPAVEAALIRIKAVLE